MPFTTRVGAWPPAYPIENINNSDNHSHLDSYLKMRIILNRKHKCESFSIGSANANANHSHLDSYYY